MTCSPVAVDTCVVDLPDLHPMAGWLYVVIARHIEQWKLTRFPSVVELAKLAHMSRASVLRFLPELEAAHLIKIHRQKAGKQNLINEYELLSDTTVVSQNNHSGISQIPPKPEFEGSNEGVVSDSDGKDKESLLHKQISVDKHRKRAREVSDLDDVPKQERLAICKAWAENLGAFPIGVYSERNQQVAAEIYRAGYRAHQVGLFVKAKKADGWWKGKTLTLAKVAELMPGWLNDTYPTAPQPRTVPPGVLMTPGAVAEEWGVNHFVRKAVEHV